MFTECSYRAGNTTGTRLGCCLWSPQGWLVVYSDRLLHYEEDMPLQAVKGHIKSNGGEYVGSTGVPHLTREYVRSIEVPIAMHLTREAV